jgi:hypothetical protein|tara:strand:- start:19 stop:837 length:819 start_codon:yes stop_codon:yes gene_type:complete
MAKKAKQTEMVEVEPQTQTVIKKELPVQAPKDTWEVKNRMYYLKGKQKPLSYLMKSANIYWFDEEKGYQRELKYCQNQKTPFVDEMVGDQRLEHIVFRAGSLFVPREETVLQKLLSLYHPHRDKIFYEYQPIKEAEDQMDVLEMEADALLAARNMDVDMAEAIMRVENGSSVSTMSSKELKRDLLIFAKKSPKLFLDLADDENVVLRNFGIKATETGILNLSADQRHFTWASNSRKLMTIPFDEHPYSALAAWFKTDEGMEIYTNIEKRLNN